MVLMMQRRISVKGRAKFILLLLEEHSGDKDKKFMISEKTKDERWSITVKFFFFSTSQILNSIAKRFSISWFEKPTQKFIKVQVQLISKHKHTLGQYPNFCPKIRRCFKTLTCQLRYLNFHAKNMRFKELKLNIRIFAPKISLKIHEFQYFVFKKFDFTWIYGQKWFFAPVYYVNNSKMAKW